MVCVCVPVLAEVERLVQKCDRSAANRSGMRKVENLVPYVDILVKNGIVLATIGHLT